MSILKKNIIIYCLLDVSYLLLSIHMIISYYIPNTFDWLAFIPFVIVFALGGYGLLIYRSKNQTVLPISEKQYQWTRRLMFAFNIIYVLFMIIIPDPKTYPALLSIGFGCVLAAISMSALNIHVSILRQAKLS